MPWANSGHVHCKKTDAVGVVVVVMMMMMIIIIYCNSDY